ncbi:MAG: threonine--tRNA ligase [Erysipelothrix sp.]|nr:threonine--tRNA ligase [Erysipelothrix sp.]
MINIKEDARLSVLNHSSAHVMAQAIKRRYPQAKFWVGPVIEDGFYYDVDLGDDVITEADLPLIEREMKKISKEAKYIVREELTKDEALEVFADDPYKIDLIQNNLSDDDVTISAYRQGEFVDLCRGPHVESTKEVKFYKLLKVSGAYWKADANNKMLQRIYGIAFDTQEDLDAYLNWLEEAKKRDHKILGRELGLFMFSEYGPGFPFWLADGVTLKDSLIDYWKQVHIRRGYDFIETPAMMSRELWEKSGHWDNYQDNMYISEIDERKFAVKPMNCPGSILIYKHGLYSYRDLPLRMAELGHVHRHEASGALNGLFRVRAFTQDDAHIYVTQEQIEAEVLEIIDFIDEVYSVFGLTYSIELSTRPEDKYIGDISVWDASETALKNACEKAGKAYKINEGDGAFYGPKLDFIVKDSLNREWQCGTVQLDMNLPDRFELNYINDHGEKVQPVMLHRVIFGSVERFIGILIEHFAGAFPVWLAPLQVRIIPVNAEYHTEYAEQVKVLLENNGIRVDVDARNEKLGYRLREAQKSKIPLQLILGDKEVESQSVNLRRYGEQSQHTVSIQAFVELALEEIENKTIRNLKK